MLSFILLQNTSIIFKRAPPSSPSSAPSCIILLRMCYVKLYFLEKINHKTLIGSHWRRPPKDHRHRLGIVALRYSSLFSACTRNPLQGVLFLELPGFSVRHSLQLLLVKGWHVFCRSSLVSGE